MSSAADKEQAAPITAPLLARLPDAEQFTEAELIAADLANNRNKAAKAHQVQERSAMRVQINDKTGAVYGSAP